MNVAEIKQKNAASKAKVEALLAEQPPARRGKSRRPAHSTPLQRTARRGARLEQMLDRQKPLFRTLIDLPGDTAQPLPLPPRLLSLIAGALAHCGASVRLRGHSLRLERRGEEVPAHIVELVTAHASAIAAWIRSRSCSDCGRPGRLQPDPASSAGAPGWTIVCPQCGDIIRP